MSVSTLKKGARLFYQKKYTEVIRLLEPQVYRFRENPNYFYFLGMSYLYTGDWGGGEVYLKKVLAIDELNTDALLGLAVVYLKKRDTHKAIKTWLEILDLDPANKKAKYSLNSIRKLSQKEGVEDFIESKKIYSFFPAGKVIVPVVPIVVVFTIAALLGAGGWVLKNTVFASKPTRPDIEGIDIGASNNIIETAGKHEWILTEDEITGAFGKAKEAMYAYDDNNAQYYLNRILYSNAASGVKEKARLLAAYLKPPTFQTIKGDFVWKDINKTPLAYNNCYILWKGKVANLAIGTEKIIFDFLIGYHEGKVLEGIIQAEMFFAEKLEDGLSYEILGRIQVVEGILKLVVIAIHPIF